MNNPTPIRKWTDKQLKQMENQLNKIYKQSRKGLIKSWNKFMNRIKPQVYKLKKNLDDAKESGDEEKIKKAEQAYKSKCITMTTGNKRYKEMVENVTADIANVNKRAVDFLNNEMPKIYSKNYNAIVMENDLSKISGISFELVDENAVKNLVENGDKSLLPQKKMNIAKDMQWNTKTINSQVLQGILQGESIDKIALRFENALKINKEAAIRNARTMTTSAECKGRMDSYKRAESDGLMLKKVWIATTDDRTRAWHSDLDGKEQEVDKPFENDYGKIMYPGDPSANPGNVYNCRCSIKSKIVGYGGKKF